MIYANTQYEKNEHIRVVRKVKDKIDNNFVYDRMNN